MKLLFLSKKYIIYFMMMKPLVVLAEDKDGFKKYNYEMLDSYWQKNQLDHISTKVFSDLDEYTPNAVIQNHPADPSNQEKKCAQLDPDDRRKCEENNIALNLTKGDKMVLELKVNPILESDGAYLYNRIFRLQMYYNRQQASNYDDTGEKPDEYKVRKIRRYRVLAELFLANLRLYFAETTISAKCSRMQRTNSYARTILKWHDFGSITGGYPQTVIQATNNNDDLGSMVELEFEDDWKKIFSKLWILLADTNTILRNQLQNPDACLMVPTETRRDTIEGMKGAIDKKIRDKITANLSKKTQAINTSKEKIQKVAKDLGDIKTITGRINELRRNINNTSQSLKLVAGDKMEVQSLLDKLGSEGHLDGSSTDYDASSYGTIFKNRVRTTVENGPILLQNSKADIISFYGKTKTFLLKIVSKLSLIETGDKCQPLKDHITNKSFNKLAPMAEVESQNDNISDPITFLKADFLADFEACVSAVSERVTVMKKQLSPEEKLQLEFARQMKKLSIKYNEVR